MPRATKADLEQERDQLRADLEQAEAERQAEKEEYERRLAALEALAPSAKADPRLPKHFTNEEVVKREMAAEKANGGPSANITVGREPWEKEFDERGDQLEAGYEPWNAKNPMQDCIDENTPEGHVGRMLSPTAIDKLGTRGWQPVVDGDGKHKSVGNMILGTMPKERAAARKRHYAEEHKARLRVVKQRFRESQEHARANELDIPGNYLTVQRQRIPVSSRVVEE